MPRTRAQRPIMYRDRQSRVWCVSEVAQFEREGEERFRALDRRRGLATRW
jgi:hypothetical protein